MASAPFADYPKLAGQYPDYLAKALRDYKSGARKNPIMAGMAAGLTQKDIDDVARTTRRCRRFCKRGCNAAARDAYAPVAGAPRRLFAVSLRPR